MMRSLASLRADYVVRGKLMMGALAIGILLKMAISGASMIISGLTLTEVRVFAHAVLFVNFGYRAESWKRLPATDAYRR